MCPFPIYPLYTRTVILSLDKPIADCFLFRPRKSREKCRKRSHTNVSNTLVTRPSTPPAQTAHVCFHRRKWVHTRLSKKDRTQRHTRRKRGRFGWGRYHYPRSVLRGSETLRGRVSERHTLPFFGLGRVCSRRTQRAFGTAMRLCVSLSRGVAAPLGCVIFLFLSKLWLLRPELRTFCMCEVGAVSLAPRVAKTSDVLLSERLVRRFLDLTDSSLIPAAQNVLDR